MLRLTRSAGRSERPVIFDVGANEGQTVRRFRETFAHSVIHAFEPGPRAFERLQARFGNTPGVSLHNLALSDTPGEREFHESTITDMSSFLQAGPDGWGREGRQVKVRLDTVDRFRTVTGIDRIDILKSDTQGFDLEVLRGADESLRSGAIHLIFVEIVLAEIYLGLPGLDEIFKYLRGRDYRLVSFYRCHYTNDRASWTDALFAYTPEHGPPVHPRPSPSAR